MRKHDLHLERRQSWCVSTDPEFSRKAADVVGLYLNPPDNALVLCVDEKPCIQALERAQGWIRLPNVRALTGFAHEYKRHGTAPGFSGGIAWTAPRGFFGPQIRRALTGPVIWVEKVQTWGVPGAAVTFRSQAFSGLI
jgi:hypothetical protein